MSQVDRHPHRIAFQYFAIVVALVFVGQIPLISGLLSGAGGQMVNQIASVVGMSVGVPQNGVNLLAQSLEQKEIELTEREKAIDARERDVRAIVLDENVKNSKFMLSIIIGVTLLLTILITLNFYMDRKRTGGDIRSATSEGVNEVHAVKTGTHAHEGEYQTRL